MQPNIYSEGAQQASLSRDQIQAGWGRGDGAGARIRVLNEAFRLYHRYRNRIERLARRDWGTSWAMLRELEDAGDTGWDSGVQDLDDAFQHLIKNSGQWTDQSSRAYWGLNEPSVYRVQVLDAPAAAANFLAAVNGKLKRLGDLAAEFRYTAQALLDPDVKLRKLRDIVNRAAALGWLAPAPPAQLTTPVSLMTG